MERNVWLLRSFFLKFENFIKNLARSLGWSRERGGWLNPPRTDSLNRNYWRLDWNKTVFNTCFDTRLLRYYCLTYVRTYRGPTRKTNDSHVSPSAPMPIDLLNGQLSQSKRLKLAVRSFCFYFLYILWNVWEKETIESHDRLYHINFDINFLPSMFSTSYLMSDILVSLINIFHSNFCYNVLMY